MNDISYIDWYSVRDTLLLEKIGNFIKYHRIKKNLSQEQVSSDANISRSTLSLLERGKTVTLSTLLQVLRTLELLHVMNSFQVQKQISPIAIAKMEEKERKRASGNTSKLEEPDQLDW